MRVVIIVLILAMCFYSVFFSPPPKEISTNTLFQDEPDMIHSSYWTHDQMEGIQVAGRAFVDRVIVEENVLLYVNGKGNTCQAKGPILVRVNELEKGRYNPRPTNAEKLNGLQCVVTLVFTVEGAIREKNGNEIVWSEWSDLTPCFCATAEKWRGEWRTRVTGSDIYEEYGTRRGYELVRHRDVSPDNSPCDTAARGK